MTITNKITLVVVGILLLLCSVLAVAEFAINLAFLKQEMQLHANSALQNMSVALIPILETGDREKSDIFFSTVMSEGTMLQNVTLQWMFDGDLQNWTYQSDVIQTVPEWFISLGFVEPIWMTTTINNGWTDLATLSITVTSDYAYLALWELSGPFTLFALSIIVIATLLVRFTLKRALSPVLSITKEAKRIAKLDFSARLPDPKASDLSELTNAFNEMSSQLHSLFETLNEEINALRQKYLFDQASGFPNRSFFMRQLESWLSDGDCGVVMLINLRWLESDQHNEGAKSLNDCMRSLNIALQNVIPRSHDAFAARLGKAELAILIPSVHEKEARTILSKLIRAFNNEVLNNGLPAANAYTIGIAEKQSGDTVSSLLSRTNDALQHAEDTQSVFHFSETLYEYSQTTLRSQLEDAVCNNAFNLMVQPIFSNSAHTTQHYEVYAHILLGNKSIPASNLISDLSRFSLSTKFDQCVISHTMDILRNDPTIPPLSINLTPSSVKDFRFITWLVDKVRKNKLKDRIYFEFAEVLVCLHLNDCEKACAMLKHEGIRFGIDRFGQHLSSITYLKSLKPDFIKLDHSFLEHCEDDNNHLLLKPMIKMASSLGIEVIISAVEYKQQLALFSDTQIDGYFGYISPPVPLREDLARSA
ncbi:EAL domain-containing protein [Enterovibrio sp. ZSDZ35]|uniref:EAL domain-containing protein n=1 Tax=Enterovibrio qingdaonensis TaxID=2899818 RepID=A0ABT5QHK1_9GAMM|nr:EAL domain-containing protein [Enterovibrio sp. ZSDZ35]MDD1780455.1 EAL domain-containing protein [Enterovibrio sp. ZSDZ35]